MYHIFKYESWQMIGCINIILYSSISCKRNGVDSFGQMQPYYFTQCYIFPMIRMIVTNSLVRVKALNSNLAVKVYKDSDNRIT